MPKLLACLFLLANSLATSAQVLLAFDGTDWNNIPEYVVKGRKGAAYSQRFSFAQYYTTNITELWADGTSGFTKQKNDLSGNRYVPVLPNEYHQNSHTLFFAFQDSAGLKADVYCVNRLARKEVSIINGLAGILVDVTSSNSIYYAQIFIDPAQAPWHLVLDSTAAKAAPKSYQTKLAKSKDEYYVLTACTKIRHKQGKVIQLNFDYAGFQIRNKMGEAVAAVSVINKGIVYLKNLPPQERLVLAAACAALLLQQEI
jgi:hypothetical protein